MSTDQIKVGIVGVGRMGITHHAIINSHPNVKVEAVAEPSSVMNTLLEKYVAVKAFKDAATMIEKVHLDAILVCTPPALNYDILVAAQRKGLHAFVEKPFLLSSEKGYELARLYEQSGLVGQVGYVNRFNDVFATVKRLLSENLLGEIICFRSEMYSSTIVAEQDESGWRSSHESGGGAAYEMASHAIDLVCYLFGRPDDVAGSRLTRVYSKKVEDIVSSTFVYKNGATGFINVNWSDASYRKPTNKLEVLGRKGKLLADQYGLKVYLHKDDEERNLKEGWNQLYITDMFNNVPFYVRGIEFTAQIYHFVDNIRATSGRQIRCSFADASATLSVIEEIFRDSALIEEEIVT